MIRTGISCTGLRRRTAPRRGARARRPDELAGERRPFGAPNRRPVLERSRRGAEIRLRVRESAEEREPGGTRGRDDDERALTSGSPGTRLASLPSTSTGTRSTTGGRRAVRRDGERAARERDGASLTLTRERERADERVEARAGVHAESRRGGGGAGEARDGAGGGGGGRGLVAGRAPRRARGRASRAGGGRGGPEAAGRWCGGPERNGTATGPEGAEKRRGPDWRRRGGHLWGRRGGDALPPGQKGRKSGAAAPSGGEGAPLGPEAAETHRPRAEGAEG